jgi:hypothetical protein
MWVLYEPSFKPRHAVITLGVEELGKTWNEEVVAYFKLCTDVDQIKDLQIEP